MSLQTAPEWFTVAGLAIDIVAVVLLAWELLLKKAAPQGSLHRGLSGCPTVPPPRVWDSGTRGGELPI